MVAAPPPQDAVLSSAADPFVTEGGQAITNLTLRFEAHGTLNATGDNAMMVFHGLGRGGHLAGSYDAATFGGLSVYEQGLGPHGMWTDLVGPGQALDTDHLFIVSPNSLGGCHGSTGPTSINPATGQPYGSDFPELTIRDMVRAHARLAQYLGIRRLRVMGPSFGGMQALEFAIMFPELTSGLCCICMLDKHTLWSKGLNPVALGIIRRDPAFQDGRYQQQPESLAVAWAVLLPMLRTPESFKERWRDHPPNEPSGLLHEARRYAAAFDANTFILLTTAADGHDIARERGPVETVLGSLAMPRLFVAIDTDQLFSPQEIEALSEAAGGDYVAINSIHGHIAAMVEQEQMAPIIRRYVLSS